MNTETNNKLPLNTETNNTPNSNNKSNINIIVACDSEYGIGKWGEIPWHCKEDLQNFKKLTLNNFLIMGRKTAERIPYLEDRLIFVLSRTLTPNSEITHKIINRNYSDINDCKELVGKNECIVMDNLKHILDFIEHLKISYTPPFFLKSIYSSNSEVFIAGGGKIYKLMNTFIRENKNYNYILHITKISKNYDCSTFFKMDMKHFYTSEKKELENNTQEQKDLIKRGFHTDRYNTFLEKNIRVVVYYKMIYNPNGEKQYLELLDEILKKGDYRQTRNAITYSLFNRQLNFDLRNGFPLLTTKKMFFRGIVEELLFFLRGDTNTLHLEEKGVSIWKGNTSRKFLDTNEYTKDYIEGDMGPMYGYQLRRFNRNYKGCNREYNRDGWKYDLELKHDNDQLYNVIQLLKNDKYSRRILMTTYNPAQADKGVLYPCHSLMIQFYVSKKEEGNNEGKGSNKEHTECEENNEYYLDMYCYNRSSDAFLGLPFNIASSALLLTLISKAVGYTPRYLHLSLGDVHIYKLHTDSVLQQLKREPYIFPSIEIENVNEKTLLEFSEKDGIKYEDIRLKNYMCHNSIKAEMIE